MRKITITVDDATSLSARRAWIEMRGINCKAAETAKSLSARRAWIEMTYVTRLPRCQVVALRKESVDRNGMEINGVSYDVCRSPQGERG